jgi:hypothetical protein
MHLEIQTKASLVTNLIVEPEADLATPVFASLKRSAALEFHATAQLLADRARFLTGAAGVAVALEHQGQFTYTAASGSLVSQIGVTADVTKYPLRKCVKTGETVHLPIEGASEGSHPPLALAILKDRKIVGFFELIPGAHALEGADVDAVSHLSDMVSTALEHLEAAEHSASLITEAKPEAPAPPASPVLWHAPETAAAEPAPALHAPSPSSADVHPCSACGFPVSGVRSLCVDCDAHRDQPKSMPDLPAELLADQQEESWISAHGYTIASVLVSALAVAIIYWLR